MPLEVWETSNPLGRPPKYNAKTLYEKCMEYFRLKNENPWQVVEAIKSGQAAGELIEIPHVTPFTVRELFLFLGVNKDYFSRAKTEGRVSKEFLGVVSWAEEVCFTQKFNGASIGVYSSAIMSRDLGLIDKIEQKATIEIIDPNEKDDPDAN